MIEFNDFMAFVEIESKPTSNLYNYLLLEVGLLILLAAYQMPNLH
jgi:hypothetical protein